MSADAPGVSLSIPTSGSTRKLKLPADQATLQVRRLRFWRVHRPLADDVVEAIELHQRHAVSFWDALILRSAQASQCSILWSEDLSNGQWWGNQEVRNPFPGESHR
jgi:predicted nucleic acid-binding protein